MAVINRSRLIQYVSGFQIQAGAPTNILIKANRRLHRVLLNCKAVNYTGGVGLATKKLTGAGNNDCTATPTIANGVVTACAVVAGGTGYVTGDTITLVDATGTGCVLTVTAAAGAVTALDVTNGGTASAIDPSKFFDTFAIGPGSLKMRDISPTSILRILGLNNIQTTLGELLIPFTEPWRNMLAANDTTSWDLFGLQDVAIVAKVNANMKQAALSVLHEFDGLRNAIGSGNKAQLLPPDPIKWREQQFQVPAGQFDITTLPIDEAFQRIHIVGSTAGALTDFSVIADGDTKLEGTVEEIKRHYQDYGYQFGRSNYLNRNIGSNATLQGQFNPLYYFDVSYLPDVDGRLSDRLYVGNELKLRVTNSQAQTLTVVTETAPGAWK